MKTTMLPLLSIIGMILLVAVPVKYGIDYLVPKMKKQQTAQQPELIPMTDSITEWQIEAPLVAIGYDELKSINKKTDSIVPDVKRNHVIIKLGIGESPKDFYARSHNRMFDKGHLAAYSTTASYNIAIGREVLMPDTAINYCPFKDIDIKH